MPWDQTGTRRRCQERTLALAGRHCSQAKERQAAPPMIQHRPMMRQQVSRATLHPERTRHRARAHRMRRWQSRPPKRKNMDILVSYEHSLASAPEEFIVHVPSQLVNNVPANVPRALLPEYVANLIVERSPSIGKIRNLRIL
jgi:hypothetical protein